MANNGVLDWLFENERRAYPLIDRTDKTSGGYTLTNDVILDAQLVFDDGFTDIPTLDNITVSGSSVTLTVSGVDFVADSGGPFPQYLRLASNHLLVVGEGIKDIVDGSYDFTGVEFEPSVCFDMSERWKGVESLTVNATELTGVINFFEGYQFKIDFTQSTADIVLGANNLYGTPIACEHFGELDNNCEDIISYINGVTPDGNAQLKIIAGAGTTVWDDPDNHRIYVGFSFTSLDDICKPVPAKPLT